MVHRVLLVARELGLGGTERQLAETALSLDRSRFEPHVACFTSGGFRSAELRQAGVPVLELGVRSFASGSALAGARRMGTCIAAQRIELVHAFDVPADLFAVPTARFYRAPAVLSSQRASRRLISGSQRHLLRLTDRMVNAVVVNSKAVARELTAEDGVPASRMRLVYNGIDTCRFRREGPRAESPFSSGSIVIGVVCALRPEKGLKTLVEAFQKVQTVYAQTRLLIVGSGPMLAELQAMRCDGCHFEPAVGDVTPWLRAIDIFVLPSLSEALSNSLMEAMACGCCPVASDVGGNPELVQDGENGLLFPANCPSALASQLERLLRDAELRRRLAAAAERRMHHQFTREASAQRMGEVYSEFLD